MLVLYNVYSRKYIYMTIKLEYTTILCNYSMHLYNLHQYEKWLYLEANFSRNIVLKLFLYAEIVRKPVTI